MSLIGKKVSEFIAEAYHNGEFKQVTSKQLEGNWSVFFFYPADFTFVCPTELADLGNYYPEFQKIGCEIYSVSTDTHFTHKAWHDTSETIGKLQFPMLGDPTGNLAKDFDAYIDSLGLAERGTYVVNPEGKIVSYEVTSGNVGRNAKDLLRRVKALQFVHIHGDKVCPAGWEEDDEPMTPSFDLVGKI
ncbi:MAG: alkyl hydroperoxide reductase subunit C [Bacillota bacterium]|nr:alkyl hydroperoxide reductase subunit C [Bacillota bacterium]